MTKIEWTEETWNPIIGCSKISPGCDNCYAERMAGRLANIQSQVDNYGHVVEWDHGFDDDPHEVVALGKWNGKTRLVESAFEKPLHWKKSRNIFVCSMGDLFHETVDFNLILEVMFIIDICPQHTFLILTKRPQRMLEFFDEWVPNPFMLKMGDLPNVWLGVTTENQEQADKRIPILLQIPAAKRFISIEPMIDQIILTPNELNGIDWVICGGETGPKARAMHPVWPMGIKDVCEFTNTHFFFKHWGEWRLSEKRSTFIRVGKKKAGRELDGKIWNQKPKS